MWDYLGLNLALAAPSCMTLDESPHFSKPQVSPLKNEGSYPLPSSED